MANTKISQLPSYTGSAADLRWFVMNNSGETTTYKYSGYSSQLIPGTGSNSYRTPNATASGSNGLAIGYNAVSSGNNSIAIGSNSNGTSYPNVTGANSIGIGSSPQSIGPGILSIGIETNIQATNAGVVVGHNSQLYNNGVVVGNGCSSQSESIVIGNDSRGFGYRNINIGHSIGFNTGTESIAIGSGKSILNVGDYEMMIGGQSTTMTGTGNHQALIGGHSNTIGGTTSYSTILGGKDNTITGGTYQVMLGTSGRTASADYTTYVENLHTYRTPSTEVQPVSSGTTFTCNLENGAKSQFYITGTSTINITNVRDGASFMIKTQTDGNYVMTWTATGYTFVFTGGLKDPGNNVIDIFQFEVFGNVIYGNRRHNYS
jgi:hypothetical protein